MTEEDRIEMEESLAALRRAAAEMENEPPEIELSGSELEKTVAQLLAEFAPKQPIPKT